MMARLLLQLLAPALVQEQVLLMMMQRLLLLLPPPPRRLLPPCQRWMQRQPPTSTSQLRLSCCTMQKLCKLYTCKKFVMFVFEFVCIFAFWANCFENLKPLIC